MKSLLFVIALSTVFAVNAGESKRESAQAVNAACAAEVPECSSKKVGKGLKKCIHEYKKAHKEFKISDSCKAAMVADKGKGQAGARGSAGK